MHDVNRGYRCGHLVYINHPKCASTYYSSRFSAAQWRSIDFADIQWGKDCVFGFFMDPIIKHAKAITEDLWSRHYHNLEKILDLGPAFFQDLGLFGWHSMPLWVRLQHHMHQVYWMPLDMPGISGDALLEHFLSHHGCILPTSKTDRHQSESEKLLVYTRVRDLLQNGSAIIWQVLAQDIDLYNQVRAAINPHGTNWTEIYQYVPQDNYK
jgi:hypothetical protein